MAVSKEADRNHEALFPSHKSTLKVTDPELVELFDNWAFDDVLKHSVLDARTRLMVQLAAIMACQATNEYRVMLGGALNVGVSPIEVKEIVYQAVPYLGIARVFDFIHATNEVLRERGISLKLGRSSAENGSPRLQEPIRRFSSNPCVLAWLCSSYAQTVSTWMPRRLATCLAVRTLRIIHVDCNQR